MIMFVFGAGASMDSNRRVGAKGHDDVRIPLANGLFEVRPHLEEHFNRFPAIRPVVETLRDSVRGDGPGIESALEALREEAASDPGRGVQLNAILFYLQAIMMESETRWVDFTRGVSNYGELLDRLRHWQATSAEPVRLVTFNYDTLIDSAFGDALQIRVDEDEYLDSYISRDDFKLYKVHGSVNWLQAVRNDVSVAGGNAELAQKLIGLGSALRPGPEGFGIMRDGKFSLPATDGSLVPAVPAMALPLISKADFAMPSEHVRQLTDDLARVTRVLIVGWKGADTRLLALWRDQLEDGASPAVYVVSGSGESAGHIADALGKSSVFGSAFVYEGTGFSDFLSDGNDPLTRFLSGDQWA